MVLLVLRAMRLREGHPEQIRGRRPGRLGGNQGDLKVVQIQTENWFEVWRKVKRDQG